MDIFSIETSKFTKRIQIFLVNKNEKTVSTVA